jgi:hypothetical protein
MLGSREHSCQPDAGHAATCGSRPGSSLAVGCWLGAVTDSAASGHDTFVNVVHFVTLKEGDLVEGESVVLVAHRQHQNVADGCSALLALLAAATSVGSL